LRPEFGGFARRDISGHVEPCYNSIPKETLFRNFLDTECFMVYYYFR
jgi:hypothetical protein